MEPLDFEHSLDESEEGFRQVLDESGADTEFFVCEHCHVRIELQDAGEGEGAFFVHCPQCNSSMVP